MVLKFKDRQVIDNWSIEDYLQYLQSWWGLRTGGLLNPTHVEVGEGLGVEGSWFVQTQDQQVTARSPRIHVVT